MRLKGTVGAGLARLLVCALVCGAVVCRAAENYTGTDGFIEQCRRECAMRKDMMVCGKYRAVKWIDAVVQQQEYAYGPFKLIKIPAVQSGRLLPELPVTDRRSSVAELLRYVRGAAEELMTRRALVYTVEQSTGARGLAGPGLLVLDDDELALARRARTFDVSQGNFRIFKKKKNIILPILILLNLIKLKLLILPIFLGVHFIKKLLLLGSLLLPSILAHLKICKIAQPPPYHYHHPWAASAEYPADYPAAYGHEDTWDHRNDVSSSAYSNYYSQGFYNPFSYYFQNLNKQQQ